VRDRPEEGDFSVLNAILIAFQLIASFTLITLILLHAGRGGGLSDMLGGSGGGALAGSTVVEKNLDRMTVVVALVFTFTTITLDLRLT
jgi:preprotein translocase subunit SecG